MRKFLKQWLRAQVSYFFWGYVPLFFIVVFGCIAVTYFREYSMAATGIFIILTFAFVIWFTKPR